MKENFEETFLRPVGGEKVRKMGRKEGRGCIHILIHKRKRRVKNIKEKKCRNKEGEKKKERERNNEKM